MLKDTIVPKMLFLAVGLTSIGLYFMMEAGIAHYHMGPITLLGLIIGGIIFGISMGYYFGKNWPQGNLGPSILLARGVKEIWTGFKGLGG